MCHVYSNVLSWARTQGRKKEVIGQSTHSCGSCSACIAVRGLGDPGWAHGVVLWGVWVGQGSRRGTLAYHCICGVLSYGNYTTLYLYVGKWKIISHGHITQKCCPEGSLNWYHSHGLAIAEHDSSALVLREERVASENHLRAAVPSLFSPCFHPRIYLYFLYYQRQRMSVSECLSRSFLPDQLK